MVNCRHCFEQACAEYRIEHPRHKHLTDDEIIDMIEEKMDVAHERWKEEGDHERTREDREEDGGCW